MAKLKILRREGSNEPVSWDIMRYSHLLINAPTNSGKSYFIKYLSCLLQLHTKTQVAILDYKSGTDYWQWRAFDNVFLGDDIYKGLDIAYKIFEARRENPMPSSPYPPFFIIFEEYQSSIESISKKADKEKVLGQVGNLLRLSRQVNCPLVCVGQRSDSNLFPAGGRENFSARLSIARLSPQAKQMLFPDDEVNCNKGQGEVNLQFDGQPVIEARTYTIRDMDKAERLITDLLSRGLPLTDEAVARSP